MPDRSASSPTPLQEPVLRAAGGHGAPAGAPARGGDACVPLFGLMLFDACPNGAADAECFGVDALEPPSMRGGPDAWPSRVWAR
jgi:hypothetical protein